MIYFLDSTVN